MVDTRIILSALWVSTMLTYLLGDVLRIFAGDFKAGEMMGGAATPAMYFAGAILLLIPIVLVTTSLTWQYPAIRWVTIVAAAVLFLFNLVGLPTYPGAYDKF